MKCKCDFRTFMVGDGCDVCNPAKALEYARETIDEQAALIQEMGEALDNAYEELKGLARAPDSAYARPCDESIQEIGIVLAKWEESK